MNQTQAFLTIAMIPFFTSCASKSTRREPAASAGPSTQASPATPGYYFCGVNYKTLNKVCGAVTISDEQFGPSKSMPEIKCGDQPLHLAVGTVPSGPNRTIIAFGTGKYGSHGDGTTFESYSVTIPDKFAISFAARRVATLENIMHVYEAVCSRAN